MGFGTRVGHAFMLLPTSIVPLKQIEYGVYGDLIIRYPKPYSIYLRGTLCWPSSVLVIIGPTFHLHVTQAQKCKISANFARSPTSSLFPCCCENYRGIMIGPCPGIFTLLCCHPSYLLEPHLHSCCKKDLRSCGHIQTMQLGAGCGLLL